MTRRFATFSNRELARAPLLQLGDTVTCPTCGGAHALTTSKPSSPLLYFKCGGRTFLAAVSGRSVLGPTPRRAEAR